MSYWTGYVKAVAFFVVLGGGVFLSRLLTAEEILRVEPLKPIPAPGLPELPPEPPLPPGLETPAIPVVIPPLRAPQPAGLPPTAAPQPPAHAPVQVVPIPLTPVPQPPPAAPPAALTALVFDEDTKEKEANKGEHNVSFIYYLTNVSPSEVTVHSVGTSCGCTTAQLPPMPWKLPAGTNSELHVNMNVAGKVGTIVKTVTVNTDVGSKSLLVKVVVPDFAGIEMAERVKNQQFAMANRQAIFEGDCARCHLPESGKLGKDLYDAGCKICHDAEHRASMVPDLHALKHPTSREHWWAWITYGKFGTLMPAWAKSQGGPLTDEQINSLADYLAKTIPAVSASTSTSSGAH